MVLGVAGVVVTTLIFSFAGSWVFLYPLPFHSAGQWSDWVTALFSASVLLAGLSIILWCVAILVVVTGPGLGSDRGVFNRVGAAMGLGIIWPRKFVSAEPVPYPVIPLTVIAIDMIIATLPLVGVLALAQLLFIWNIVQTLRGKTSIGTQRLTLGLARPKMTSPALQGFVIVLTLLALGGLTAAGWAIGNNNADQAAAFVAAPAAPAGGGQVAEGQQVFVDAGCGGCHTLGAANATGTVGPNLDQAKPSQDLVVERVTNGKGNMPAFKDQLAPEQIAAVAAYVSQSAAASP
jgi:mono/diheme cytochrome c family protein